MENLLGVVMCGGQSRRMGTDKGLIPVGDTCWAALMAAKLADMGLPVVVSVNTSQVQAYSSFFKDTQLVVDSVEVGGPLNGLLSVHAKYPEADLLLLACDMINMEAETIKRLITTFEDRPGYDFYVYQNQQFAEPFCSIYTAAALNALVTHTDLANSSLQKVLNEAITLRLPITEPESFNNFNTLA